MEEKKPMKIVSTDIRIYSTGLKNDVIVTYEDGTRETLFRYFRDELEFSGTEFLGCTRYQAMKVFYKKDDEFFKKYGAKTRTVLYKNKTLRRKYKRYNGKKSSI